jgi:uncharacterized protein
VKGHLGHVGLADGTRVGVPVIITNGAQDGPTLVITGSVHGTEVNGSGALLRVVRMLNPAELRGCLIAIPSANPFAFQVGSYFTPFISPDDGLNLARVAMWPGDPEGRMTERFGYFIGQALQLATHSIDVHSNPEPAIPFTLVNRGLAPDDRTRTEMDTMARACGFTVIENSGRGVGVAGSSVANGVPSMTVELIGDMFLREDNTYAGQIGITNVMKAIGMLDGEPDPQPIPAMQGDFVASGRLMTNTGGLMWVRQPPGTFLREGEVAVEIMNVWGDIVEEVRMPLDGYCWSFTGGIAETHAVTEGTELAYLFRDRSKG